MKKSNITEIIQDIKAGKMVIILDDESRENEGDLVCAAELITPEIINFMASKGKGLICLPMSKELCKKYDLQMMTNKNRTANKTAFTPTTSRRTARRRGACARRCCASRPPSAGRPR